jgi:predicted RNase H-like nuclease (RuvC/YqgF family)
MSSLENLQQKLKDLQKQYELLCEKIQRLKEAKIIETETSTIFKLEKQIQEAELERGRVEKEMKSVEKEIESIPIKIQNNIALVETRARREPNGAWTPDAIWTQGPGQDPLRRYEITLPDSTTAVRYTLGLINL